MDQLNRIPLQSLRAVEAVARLGSLRRAAEALGVTPGAVSQQVLLAERQLGLTLFDRRPSGMVPTDPGREVTDLLTEGFARIGAAVARAGRGRDDALTVSVAPVFAARWLIWRLPRFQAAHPGIRVRLDADLALLNPSAGEADLCLRVGRGGWPGVAAERLFPQVIFPVCAPDLARNIRSHADLARVPVIRETRANFDWPDWLGPEGHPEVQPGDGPVFSDSMLCLDAAMTGAGVFLTFESLAADALENGRVVEPFRGRHATENAYWLVTAQDRRPGRAAQAFARWLRAETAAAGLGRPRAP
jgi:LysR family transcriptional regulator, glycine cleavage system transcriptional activator